MKVDRPKIWAGRLVGCFFVKCMRCARVGVLRMDGVDVSDDHVE